MINLEAMAAQEIYTRLLYMLEKEHSKEQMQSIVKYIGSNQQKFDTLVKIFLSEEYRIIQRASWPLGNCVEANPQLAEKHLKKLLQHMQDATQHPAVKRNVLRVFDIIAIPKKLHGELLNDCLENITDPSAAIAVQAYSLGILQKLTLIYPDIRHEVETIIDTRLPNATAAFASRAKKYKKAVAKHNLSN